MADGKSCGCWEWFSVNRWKQESMVDASRSAKNVQPQSPTIKKNPAIQRMSSDGSNAGSSFSSSPKGEELRQSSNVRVFPYNELKVATRNFRSDGALGEGGFGIVYKGYIDEVGPTGAKIATGITVAVKVLNQEGLQGHREWLAEVNFLGELHYPHLVKLIGYCCEDEHRLLVYEFMPRGSLENHLFRKTALPLPWEIRMKIALGAAKGLAFLHGAERPVIYRDFKTSNILLDSDYTAKLSDFGLAKDGPEGDQTHVSTRVMGTYGYAAPEYVMTGHLTSRSDVYSFGVVLLELLTGRRSMDKARPSGEHNLVEWARPFLCDKRKLLRIIDPRLEGQYSVKGAQKAASLSYQCLSQNPKARPLMSNAVETLEPLQGTRDIASTSYTYVAGSGKVESVGRQEPASNGNAPHPQPQPNQSVHPDSNAVGVPSYQRTPRR